MVRAFSSQRASARLFLTSGLLATTLLTAAATRDAQIVNLIQDLGGHAQVDSAGHITSVALSHCWVTDADLDPLASLHDLQKLDLSLSLITDLGMQRLKNLPNVTDLNLYAVELITDTSMAYIRDWRNLKRLNLRGTDITDTTLEYLAHVSSLRSLDISHTQVTNNGLELLGPLTGLEELVIGGNKITGAGLRVLKLMPALRVLSLIGEQKRNSGIWAVSLTDLDLDAIGALTNLEDLNLGGLKISDAGIQRLRPLRLTALDLSRTQVSGKGLSSVDLTRLARLSLQNAKRFDNSSLQALRSAAQLQVLDLSDTPIDDAGLAELTRLTGLKQLFLNGTRVTQSGLQTFRAAHPNCQVSWQ